MRMALALIGTAISATLPSVAMAATGIGCIEEKLGQAALDRIGDGVIVAVDAGTSIDRALDQDRDALIAARDACRRDNRWSSDAADLAVSYVKARATLGGVRRALGRDGLDAASVAAAYAALAPTDRRSLSAGPMTPAASRAIAAQAGAPGNNVARVNRIHHVTILFAALSAIEFYPGEFVPL